MLCGLLIPIDGFIFARKNSCYQHASGVSLYKYKWNPTIDTRFLGRYNDVCTFSLAIPVLPSYKGDFDFEPLATPVCDAVNTSAAVLEYIKSYYAYLDSMPGHGRRQLLRFCPPTQSLEAWPVQELNRESAAVVECSWDPSRGTWHLLNIYNPTEDVLLAVEKIERTNCTFDFFKNAGVGSSSGGVGKNLFHSFGVSTVSEVFAHIRDTYLQYSQRPGEPVARPTTVYSNRGLGPVRFYVTGFFSREGLHRIGLAYACELRYSYELEAALKKNHSAALRAKKARQSFTLEAPLLDIQCHLMRADTGHVDRHKSRIMELSISRKDARAEFVRCRSGQKHESNFHTTALKSWQLVFSDFDLRAVRRLLGSADPGASRDGQRPGKGEGGAR
jgi:hypothetical protein